MKPLIGTHECKADVKGRIMMPSSLKKQLSGVLQDGFVLKRAVFQNNVLLLCLASPTKNIFTHFV